MNASPRKKEIPASSVGFGLDQKGVCAIGWAVGIVIVILMIPLGTWACSMGPDCGMGPIGYYMLGAFSGICVLILFCALSIARKVAIEKRARTADQGASNEKLEK
ncbi:MAG: hypothetical protein GYA24_13395 [Candidatus Lokiarchaeota archaeon]|nr:hypothetical protein [Candidatus Lokiarchaeota archaeon]